MPVSRTSRLRSPPFLLLLAFVLLGLIYDAATPVLEAGDEQFHYPYVRHIASGGGLPLQDPSDAQAWRQEGSQPPLYYMLAALLTFWLGTSDAAEGLPVNPHAVIGVPAHGSNDNRNMLVHSPAEAFPFARTALAVHLIRWLSLAIATATVYATYRLALRIVPGDSAGLLAASLVAFNPMFGFLAGAVNNDSLVILLATLCLWQMTRLWQDGLNRRGTVLLGALLGLSALSKLSALGLAAVAGLLIVTRAWLDSRAAARPAIPWRGWWLHGTLTLLTFSAIAGWWYVRNWQLYGDLTGLNRMLAIVGVRQGTPALLPLLVAELEGMRLSFWGLFGGVNILMHPWQYVLYDALLAAGGVGIALLLVWRFNWRRLRAPGSRASAFGWLLVWAVVLALTWSRWTLITPATQGRLLFPALATFAVALALGWDACLQALVLLLRRRSPLAARVDAGGRHLVTRGTYLLVVGLGVLSLRAALFDIAPSYAPAPLLQVPAPGAAFAPLRFGDALELVGVEVPRNPARAGDVVEVALTWRAVAPMQRDYSTFVHLLDEGDLIVGQRDTYPGLGLRPATQLKQGDIVRDVLRIRVDDAALAPGDPRIRVGVYDYATQARLASPRGDNPSVGVLHLDARAADGAPTPVTYRFEDYFTLAGYRIDRVAVRAGESFTLTLLWNANRAPKDYSAFVHVLGKQDAIWGQEDRALPTRTWRAGDVIEDRYVISVKADTPPEVYDLEIGAYDAADNFKRLNIWGADGQFAGDRILLRKLRVVR